MTLNGLASELLHPRRGRRIARALLLAVLVSAAPPLMDQATACSCVGPLPPCEAASQAELVFGGLVTSVVDVHSDWRVTFDVRLAGRGSPGAPVDVFCGDAGGKPPALRRGPALPGVRTTTGGPVALRPMLPNWTDRRSHRGSGIEVGPSLERFTLVVDR